MYIYTTDLYLYESVYRSINLSTMYFKAERSKLCPSLTERWDILFAPLHQIFPSFILSFIKLVRV